MMSNNEHHDAISTLTLPYGTLAPAGADPVSVISARQ